MKLSALLILLVPLLAKGQLYSTRSHGTFLISIITSDGIVTGADSRLVAFEKSKGNRVYSAVDGVRKIFTYDKLIIQCGGLEEVGKYTVTGLLHRFFSKKRASITVDNFYSNFVAFISGEVSPSELKEFKEDCQFIVSGYLDATPKIYFYSHQGMDVAVATGTKTNKAGLNYDPSLLSATSNLNNKAAAAFIKTFISEMGKSGGRFAIIGGPVTIITLDKQGDFLGSNDTFEMPDTVVEEMVANYRDKHKRIYQSKADSIIYKKSIKHVLQSRFHTEL